MNQLPEGCQFSSVVKGNAYGHGLKEFVELAVEVGQREFSTYSADEAYSVVHATKHPVRVTIMGNASDDGLEWAVREGIPFWVFDPDRYHAAKSLARRFQRKARVHLELETGMNRNGLSPEAFERIVDDALSPESGIEVVGMCSHLAGAESSANDFRVAKQISRFETATRALRRLHPKLKRHLACSAAVMQYPETCFDRVRVGIMQYGFFPTAEVRMAWSSIHPTQNNPLHRVLTWKTKVMNTFEVERGEFVGYGTAFQATDGMRLANIPIGYSHGYSRSLSNLGHVLIRGQRAPVVGVVNMNQLTVQITHLDGVVPGDEVVLIGRQGEEEITVASFADTSSQVNYEMLTRLPADIPRVVVD